MSHCLRSLDLVMETASGRMNATNLLGIMLPKADETCIAGNQLALFAAISWALLEEEMWGKVMSTFHSIHFDIFDPDMISDC